MAKLKTKILEVFATTMDDYCHLKPQTTLITFNAETRVDSPDSTQPHSFEFEKPSKVELDATNLTLEAHEAIVECLRIAARRGRILREACEHEQVTRQAGSPQDGLVDNSIQSESIDENYPRSIRAS